jgi:hypothetical protein
VQLLNRVGNVPRCLVVKRDPPRNTLEAAIVYTFASGGRETRGPIPSFEPSVLISQQIDMPTVASGRKRGQERHRSCRFAPDRVKSG